MGRKNDNLKTIAYELGVSINTVSHALRDMDDISEPTKQKVRRKAIEMGYISSAVSLNPKKTELPLLLYLYVLLTICILFPLPINWLRFLRKRASFTVLFCVRRKSMWK